MASYRQYRRARAALLAAQPWCSYCGSTTDLTADHLVPRSLGGRLEHGITVACRTCNSSRGNRQAPKTRTPRARFSRNATRFF